MTKTVKDETPTINPTVIQPKKERKQFGGRGGFLHPFCHLVIKAVRVDSYQPSSKTSRTLRVKVAVR